MTQTTEDNKAFWLNMFRPRSTKDLKKLKKGMTGNYIFDTPAEREIKLEALTQVLKERA